MVRDAVICILFLGLIGSGCEDRARVNPLDPLNSSTDGRPQQFHAVAEHQRITLSWNKISVADLQGYRLRRSEVIGGVSSARDIFVSSQYNRYVDLQVINGQTYRYSVTAMITSGSESPPSGTVDATPGPSSCWVADTGADALFRTSADGQAIAVQVVGLSGPVAISTDPNDGGCWTTEPFSGLLVRATANGELDVITRGLTHPVKVAVDVRDGACWVVEDGSGIGQTSAATRVSRDGIIQFRVFAFTDPEAITVNPLDGNAWVADLANRQVSIIDAHGNIRFTAGGFEAPVGLVADPTDGGCWVIDRDMQQVVKLNATGGRSTIVSGFINPVDGSYDEGSGNLWIADPGRNAVIKLITGVPNGYDITRQQGFHQTIGELQNPLSVSADARTGDCWVAVADDRLILKLLADGQVAGAIRLSESSFPRAVSVDTGSRYDTPVP